MVLFRIYMAPAWLLAILLSKTVWFISSIVALSINIAAPVPVSVDIDVLLANNESLIEPIWLLSCISMTAPWALFPSIELLENSVSVMLWMMLLLRKISTLP